MKALPAIFLSLSSLYKAHGFSLYLIGGASRDLLLGLPCSDLDLTTDATPEEEKAFLENADFTFARFGSVCLRHEGGHIDITTLRKEWGYEDQRHPAHIEFVRDLEVDSSRRDFTVNALYMDDQGNVFDFHDGLKDLETKTLRFIGDPYERIKEDPLRIIRAERFAKRLGFQIEPKAAEAMKALEGELLKLNPDKVLMEKKKA